MPRDERTGLLVEHGDDAAQAGVNPSPPPSSPKSIDIDDEGVGRRHEVADARNGEVIVRMLGFPGPGWVRMVCVAELQRDGYTLTRDEAEKWRDALTDAIAEIDAYKPDEHSCDKELRAVPNGWGISGFRQDGERWTCSCGLSYIHVCDEAEGCYWSLDDESIAPEDMPATVAL